MRINFDFNDLEAFLAVMETNSFHHAAERLSLSQSAVTRRVQKLEEALGSPLFERTTRAVRPTLAAKRLQVRAEAMLEGARETALAMRDESVAFAYQRNSVITLAMIPTVVASLLPSALREFRNQGFNARIRLLDFAANEVAEAVSQGDADFGVCSIGSLDPNTRFETLFNDPIGLAIPSTHILASQDRVDWANLEGHPLILPARGTGNRLLIDETMAKSRLTAQWSYEVGRSTTAMELVSEGVGIALLPRSVIKSTQGTSLTFKDLLNPEVARPIGLLSRSGIVETDAIRALKDGIRQASAN
ncbi:MAG: LysR family transcriptional regulator [Roseibium sp.]|uniref:LysR family transcriptional regulator n=1 Tax=Roseibium sp. TaxID=1936156 RepID=UPI002629750E|nr:LysR family transcriptional regulator [Roseibium sp.]MCV0423878.1 LysR family transcriptional regulator [Roseibium sp.]